MGERKKRGWKRTKRSITPAENNFTNVYVFDYVRCFLSVIITINISAACGKASHSELWKKLGVSRWEMAMRTSVSQLNGGFAVAPFLASYSPNAKKIKPGEKRTSTSKLRHLELWSEWWCGIRSERQRKLLCEGCTGSWRERDKTAKNSSGWVFGRFFLTVTMSQRIWRWFSVIIGSF